MEYFFQLTQSKINELIRKAEEEIFICLPSIHADMASALKEKIERYKISGKPSIQIMVDFDPQTFRQGYGDFKSVKDLIQAGAEIKHMNANRISFMLIDEIGYYLFVESRSMMPADKEIINAVKIDPISIIRLKKFFFNSIPDRDLEDQLTNAIIEESKVLGNKDELIAKATANTEIPTTDRISAIENDLTKNPPIHPDYKRLVDFYSNKFQYVRLKFEGANLRHHKVQLPKKAIPVADSSLRSRLETKLNLFDAKASEEVFKPMKEFKDKVDELREEYLKKVKSREESILDKNRSADFTSAVNDLANKIGELKKNLLIGVNEMIKSTKTSLIEELVPFIKANPKGFIKSWEDEKWMQEPSYLEEKAQEIADTIIKKIKWPEAHLLLKDLKLETRYSEISFSDLKNKSFLKELKEAGIINSTDISEITEISTGIATKSDAGLIN